MFMGRKNKKCPKQMAGKLRKNWNYKMAGGNILEKKNGGQVKNKNKKMREIWKKKFYVSRKWNSYLFLKLLIHQFNIYIYAYVYIYIYIHVYVHTYKYSYTYV